MLRLLRILGQRTLNWLATLGRSGIVWMLAIWGVRRMGGVSLVVHQIYNIGVLSLVIIALSGFSIGAVIALQFYTQLARFGAEEAVGLGLALVVLRELGPVVTALLFAGRAGSAITAEIGLMKSTDQLSSMEMIGVDPLHRIVAPRLWAGIICLPLLTFVFNVVALYGGSVVSIDWLGVDPSAFWAGMQETVEFYEDVVKGSSKSVVFAVVVTWIAVFQGYDTVPTPEGIGIATTKTVVFSSVAILALDFLLTLIMYGDFQ
ncbi:MAG: lipid asymmetry maintenance ABC transporter permease subunit MlaE [Gammaproteobacteria bacterium]|nr:lipid asymmetry maintenance ABC transporter permease subunit MlaE [Gammaproteobacteria bacterium]